MSEELVVNVPSAMVESIETSTLETIEAFEEAIEEMGVNEKDAINENGMTDHLVNGMYGRALRIPKGMLLTGKIHARDYVDIFISGHVTVKSFLADGEIEESVDLTEFQFLPGRAGRKRVLYAHEDTLWVTVDPTAATEIAKVEEDVIFSTMDQYNKRIGESV